MNKFVKIGVDYGETQDDNVIVIMDKKSGKILLEWNDNAHIDYPEDLSWNRMIGDLFYESFELGYKYGKEENNNE